MTGDITISTDSEITWHRNTDLAAIGFKNTGDGDTDSYMWFKTGDNGNEYFKWNHIIAGGGTSEWMSLKSDNLRVKGHPVYHQGNKPTAADVGAYSKAETDIQINKVDSQFNQFKANLQEYIPLPLNLFSNSMMRSVEPEGHPTNYSAVGCTIQAVHPYTKGFEGIYTETAPSNVAPDPDSANENNPYWYGRYYLGARMGRGGLGNGWGSINSGKILKITSTAFSGKDKYFKIPVETHGVFEQLGIRFWVKIVKGKFGMGTDSGYKANERGDLGLGYIIEKADANSAQDGWLFVEKLISISRVTTLQDNAIMFGLPYYEDCEIYLALPYLYVPMSNKSMTVSSRG
ncbi:putative E14 prophage tail fiber protein [Xenorhabdus mauleonii]|uniref:E14 prophage tail fiber protein n=1 Tax=Xenorhabdus mauleonii TaxID=351675 RepID=A0A2G0NFG8_9GAMM|nr:putative E14 prophage tail fiber protein [Xenorhabdus mauleonii]